MIPDHEAPRRSSDTSHIRINTSGAERDAADGGARPASGHRALPLPRPGPGKRSPPPPSSLTSMVSQEKQGSLRTEPWGRRRGGMWGGGGLLGGRLTADLVLRSPQPLPRSASAACI